MLRGFVDWKDRALYGSGTTTVCLENGNTLVHMNKHKTLIFAQTALLLTTVWEPTQRKTTTKINIWIEKVNEILRHRG